jgi:HK97 family phage prohead protease
MCPEIKASENFAARVAHLFQKVAQPLHFWYIFNKATVSKPITFCLNDELIVNQHGFRTVNKGISLERFNENPVVVIQHENNVWKVVGRLVNLRFEGSKFLGDIEFDLDDEDSKKIAGKVQRGFLKGCSMGLTFYEPHMVKAPDGEFDLTVSELIELSLVAIPSNKNSVRLFAANGESLADNEIKLSISQVTAKLNKDYNKKHMEKFVLSAVALSALTGFGLKNHEDSGEVNNAIEALSVKLNAVNSDLSIEKTAHDALKAELAEQKKASAKSLIANAKLAGKVISADLEAELEDMAIEKYALAEKLINGMPGKTSLSSIINNQTPEERKNWTYKDWQEKDAKGLELMFKNDKAGFDVLFNKK